MEQDKAGLPWNQRMSIPLEQYAFIHDERLKEAPTVRELARPLDPVAKWTHCEDILDRFLQERDSYAIPVVDGDMKPVTLVERNTFLEFFARLFTREIYGRRPVSDIIGSKNYKAHEPIVVEHSCTVEDAAQIIIGAGMKHMVTGFVVTKQDAYLGVVNGHDLLNLITQRKQAELFYLAHYDHLTGLPNRMLLNDRLTRAILDGERKNTLAALLFIDVDRFKTINDSMGHSFGDAVLRTLATRLRAAARKSDTVARIGGDEFVILMEDLGAPDDAEMVAQRLLDSMRTPVELLGHSLVITVSIGIAMYPRDDSDASRLLAKADTAMYVVKTAGRNGFQAYREGQNIYDSSRLKLENDLRHAIACGGLQLHYQPLFEFASREVKGSEALVRWPHPTLGMISPLEFIPLAEECGLIHDLGEWVLREACRQLQRWQDQGLPLMRMSINVSSIQFRQAGFTDTLLSVLADSGVDPSLITLELTESVLMHDADEILETMMAIRELGFNLAVDDFGTGYSSLNYLRRFPISCLKIDQSFVRDIHNTPANESITRAIIALAESLSLNVVAEGIETGKEQGVLETLGCSEGQGYYFSKPLSATDFARWVRANLPALHETAETAARCVPGTGH